MSAEDDMRFVWLREDLIAERAESARLRKELAAARMRIDELTADLDWERRRAS